MYFNDYNRFKFDCGSKIGKLKDGEEGDEKFKAGYGPDRIINLKIQFAPCKDEVKNLTSEGN